MLSRAAASFGDVPEPLNSSTAGESADVDWPPQVTAAVVGKTSGAISRARRRARRMAPEKESGECDDRDVPMMSEREGFFIGNG